MTEEKKKRIKELRLSGYGYSSIAALIFETRDTVRNYCRKIGLDGVMGKRNPHDARYTEEKVKEKVSESTNGRYEYIGGYIDADNKIDIRCSVCGGVFSRYYRDVIFKGYDCPKCKEKLNEAKTFRRIAKNYEDKLNDLISIAIKRNNLKSTCPVCGKEFIKGKRRKYCSNKCANKNRNRIKDNRIDPKAIVDKDITLQSLYKKDGGVCHLCGGLCDWEDYVVRDGVVICGDWYPSIDHVIPVSKGGLHSWENVKLAHRKCNTRKGNHMPPGAYRGYITRATGWG